MCWLDWNSRMSANLATQSNRSRQRMGSASKSVSTPPQSWTKRSFGRVTQVANLGDGLPIIALNFQAVGALAVVERDVPVELGVARNAHQRAQGIGQNRINALGTARQRLKDQRRGCGF